MNKRVVYNLLCIYLIFLFILGTNIVFCEPPHIDYGIFFIELKKYLLHIIKEDVFIDKYGTKHMNNIYAREYYLKVICHDEFINGFIDFLKNKKLLENVSTIKNIIPNLITPLFFDYVENYERAMDYIIKRCLPPGFRIEEKSDLLLFLKEYAKLLPITKSKLDIALSEDFLEKVFSRINFEDYKHSKDFTENNMIALKRFFIERIYYIHAEKIIFHDLRHLYWNSIAILRKSYEVSIFWFKQHIPFFDIIELYNNTEYISRIFHLSVKRFSLDEHLQYYKYVNDVMLYADIYIITNDVLNVYKQQFFDEKYMALLDHVFGFIKITLEENKITVQFGLVYKYTFNLW